jgi:8-oxo-dGTP pyrophosphatase MutT (NUDIX family)
MHWMLLLKIKSNKIRFHYVLIVFLASSIGGQLKLSNEHYAIKWVSIKKAETYKLTKTCRKILRKFKKLNF